MKPGRTKGRIKKKKRVRIRKKQDGICTPRRELERGKAPEPCEVPPSDRRSARTEEELYSIGGEHSNGCEAVKMETVLHSQCYGKPYADASRCQELKF